MREIVSPFGGFFIVRRQSIHYVELDKDQSGVSINTLYQAVINGDSSAETKLFSELYEAFRLFVGQRVRDADEAEDIVQETLATVSRKYREVDFTISFSAWAYRILEFKLLHHYRSKRHFRRLMEGVRREDLPTSVEPEDIELRNALIECLRKINQVNARYARILALRYQGYTTDEMSGFLETTSHNIHNLLSRARALLKTCLERGEI
jgi:RNA polymerase sigma-70 factor (ECF subfamily)